MKLSGNKKIIMFGIILLIIAGIVVVALKGFNVDVLLKQHESIHMVIGKEIDISNIKAICKDVFQNKRTVIRTLEVFDDSINISAISITDEEKENLVSKINEAYGTEISVDSITVNTTPNIRIRDLIRPYIKPIIISVILIAVYMIIRFRKMNTIKLLGNILITIIVTQAVLASIIAILRIPLSSLLMNIMLVIALIELILYISQKEKEYKTSTEKQNK